MNSERDLLQYLPTVLHEAPAGKMEGEALLARFLKIFETQFARIEAKVDRIPQLFDPWTVEAALLPYLASWLGLELPQTWGERAKRSVLANIVAIHRTRGTHKGLTTMLTTFQGTDVQVSPYKVDPQQPFTRHLFVVTVNLNTTASAPEEKANRTRAIRKILDREKPAHTDYILEVMSPTMQINFHSTVAVDTILGTQPNPDFKNE